jgi:hypothetical protein
MPHSRVQSAEGSIALVRAYSRPRVLCAACSRSCASPHAYSRSQTPSTRTSSRASQSYRCCGLHPVHAFSNDLLRPYSYPRGPPSRGPASPRRSPRTIPNTQTSNGSLSAKQIPASRARCARRFASGIRFGTGKSVLARSRRGKCNACPLRTGRWIQGPAQYRRASFRDCRLNAMVHRSSYAQRAASHDVGHVFARRWALCGRIRTVLSRHRGGEQRCAVRGCQTKRRGRPVHVRTTMTSRAASYARVLAKQNMQTDAQHARACGQR